MDIITLQEYKTYNGITKPTDDPKVSMLISFVSSLIKAYIGRDFSTEETVTEVISLDYDTNQIFLEKYPVREILSITETDRYTWDSTVHVPLLKDVHFDVNMKEGIITRSWTPGSFANWPINPGVVRVEYITGTNDLFASVFPEDLKLAAIELVNYYKNDEFRQSKALQGASIVNSVPQGTDFPQHIQVILDRYR